jgi:hypothetical protein
MMMIRSFGPLLLLVLCAITARAEDEAKAVVKKKAQEICQSIVKADYSKVADLTYPKVVELMGGRDKMIDSIRASMKQMSDGGITIKSLSVDEPSGFLSEGKNTFVIVPTSFVIVGPGVKVITRSYLLGISPDRAKTWTFIDGTGLDDKEKRDKILPKLPAELKLPEKQKPEIIKVK